MHLISTFLDIGLVLHVCLVEITWRSHCGVCHLQESWTNASKKQREKLLELIRRLAEDDKEGVMAHKVNLSWITLLVIQTFVYQESYQESFVIFSSKVKPVISSKLI